MILFIDTKHKKDMEKKKTKTRTIAIVIAALLLASQLSTAIYLHNEIKDNRQLIENIIVNKE